MPPAKCVKYLGQENRDFFLKFQRTFKKETSDFNIFLQEGQ